MGFAGFECEYTTGPKIAMGRVSLEDLLIRVEPEEKPRMAGRVVGPHQQAFAIVGQRQNEIVLGPLNDVFAVLDVVVDADDVRALGRVGALTAFAAGRTRGLPKRWRYGSCRWSVCPEYIQLQSSPLAPSRSIEWPGGSGGGGKCPTSTSLQVI